MTDEAHYDDLVPRLRAKDAYREFSPGLGYRLGPGHMILTASQDWTYLKVRICLHQQKPKHGTFSNYLVSPFASSAQSQ